VVSSSQHGDVNADDVNGNVSLNLDHGSARLSEVSGDVSIQGRGDDVTLTTSGRGPLNGELDWVKLSRVGKRWASIRPHGSGVRQAQRGPRTWTRIHCRGNDLRDRCV